MHGLSLAGMALAAGVSFFASPVVADLDPLIVKGNHFFYKSNGTQFYIKGVAYQQDFNGNGSTSTQSGDAKFTDPLADSSRCDTDVPLLAALGTNTIRVYAIDPTLDHSHCMNLLQNAGIYVISDLSAPGTSINSDSPQWNYDLYTRYSSVIDSLSNYTNVIGFFAGNEVAHSSNTTASLAFVKAAVRDMKNYVSTKSRAMYVGYASSDNDGIRTQIEDYLNCGSTNTSIDFFGYNIYSWCGNSDFKTSQYQARTEELAGYPVPAFFAEYGCNTNGVRTFQETGTLFGSQMTGVWSGGIVYEYFQADNNYGLVSVSGSSVSKLPDYSNLASAIASVSPTILNAASYTPTNTALRNCPTQDSTWQANPTIAPAVNKQLCDCMVSSLSCNAKDSIASDKAGQLFDYICGSGKGQAGIDCTGISGNGTTGKYGAYSMCSTQQRLAWAFNAYYSAQSGSNKASACSFNGNATTQNPSTSSGNCGSLVSQAGGTAGTGTSTANPNNAATSSKSAAGAVTIPSVDMGVVKMGVWVLAAAAAGTGLIFF